MQHFLNLEKCNCGAYRYLAVREHKKSYEIYLIHHKHFSAGENVRKYAKLASIPKFKINIHDPRIQNEQRQRNVRLSYEEISILKSVLSQISSDPRSQFGAETPVQLEEEVGQSSTELEEQEILERNIL